jgi:6-pyruvoyltetrahydropterin/6-carboxytetrahydropterin synthase
MKIKPVKGSRFQTLHSGTTMYEIAKELCFSYGHRLLNHAGKCKLLHGHNGRVTITLAAETLDSQDMVMDFSVVKDVAKRWIDEQFDHQMLLHKDDPLIPVLKTCGEHYRALDMHPTAESLARIIFDYLRQQKFPVTAVTLWETESCYAIYRA